LSLLGFSYAAAGGFFVCPRVAPMAREGPWRERQLGWQRSPAPPILVKGRPGIANALDTFERQRIRRAIGGRLFRNELGYLDGRDIVIEYRSAQGQPDRLAAVASDLAGLSVDVIVTSGSAACGGGLITWAIQRRA
jgi:hypothetical protein